MFFVCSNSTSDVFNESVYDSIDHTEHILAEGGGMGRGHDCPSEPNSQRSLNISRILLFVYARALRVRHISILPNYTSM